MAWVSDTSKDFIINESDRPDGMRKEDDFSPPSGFKTGYVERDLEAYPVGSLYGSSTISDFSKNVPLIPMDQWPALLEEQERNKRRLSDIRMIGNKGEPIPSLDQNGQGYCWSYSTCHGIMLTRAVQGQPYIRLSGHSLAWRIKNGKDEGGWCGLSTSEAAKYGYQPVSTWPEKSMQGSKYNTEANWEVAQNFRIEEGFLDVNQKVWDMDLTFQQIGSCLLSGIACPVDYDWWSHSILGMDLVYVTNKFPVTDIRCWGIRIWNSWRDSWGALGTGVILGKKAVPMGATAIRSVPYYDGV